MCVYIYFTNPNITPLSCLVLLSPDLDPFLVVIDT